MCNAANVKELAMVARRRTLKTSQLHDVRVLAGGYRFIGMHTLDLRPRQGIQAVETHLLLPEDLTDPDAELRALPKSARFSFCPPRTSDTSQL